MEKRFQKQRANEMALKRVSSWRLLALMVVFAVTMLGAAPSARADIDTDCAAGSTDTNTTQGALNGGSLGFITTALANANKTYSDSIDADNQNNNENQRGSNKDKKCLKKITSDYFKSIIQKLHDLDTTSLASLLKSFLDKLIDDLTGLVCNWVATTINNLLSTICLPLPNLGSLSLSLPTISASSCNGISLRDLVSVSTDYSQSSVSLDLSIPNAIRYYGNMSRGVDPKTGTPMY